MRKIMMAAMVLAGVQGAQAADMPDFLRGSYSSAGPSRPMWEGFYIGGQAAEGWIDTKPLSSANSDIQAAYLNRTGLPIGAPNLGAGNGSATGYGGFVGYNSQFEDVVVGIEANYLHDKLRALSNNSLNTYLNGVLTSTSQSNVAVTVKDFGSLRLRGGYMIGNFLPYAFAGVGVGTADTLRTAGISYLAGTPTLPAFQAASQTDHVLYGYSLGVGVDVCIIGGLFARAEYEYTRYTSTVETQINTVRVGLGYKF